MKLRTALEVLTNEDPRYKKKIDEAVKTLQQALMQHKKEWVGLTDEERRGIREWQEIQKELGPVWAPMMLYLYLAIEAKLKEKNT